MPDTCITGQGNRTVLGVHGVKVCMMTHGVGRESMIIPMTHRRKLDLAKTLCLT